jgi:hypothetical protein
VIVEHWQYLVDAYSDLLVNPISMRSALLGLQAIVSVHGFAPVSKAMAVAISQAPDEATTALIAALPEMQTEDHGLVLVCADQLRWHRTFLMRLWEVAQFFDDKRPFLEFLDLKDRAQWRDRFVILRQAICFLPSFRNDLVDLAVCFAKDDAAIVRNESVKLWVEGIKQDRSFIHAFEKLVTGKWQSRLIATKIVAQTGVLEEFEGYVRQLGQDSVENVRFSLSQTFEQNLTSAE